MGVYSTDVIILSDRDTRLEDHHSKHSLLLRDHDMIEIFAEMKSGNECRTQSDFDANSYCSSFKICNFVLDFEYKT